MNLGVRAHDFGKLPASVLADRIAAHGLTGIQLALAKAIEGINSDTGALSPGLATHLRDTFAQRGIRVAVLGCYVNICHPDLSERTKLMTRFKEHLRFARDFGTSVVATETGNCGPGGRRSIGSEAAFNLAVSSVAELAAEAEKFGVFATIEGVSSHVISTPQRLRRMLDAVKSNNLQILFDPVNLLSADNYTQQERIMKESFELFGDRIVVVHAKDFVIENGRFRSVSAGQGQLDYGLLMSLLKQHKSWIDVVLEDTFPDTIAASIEHVQGELRSP